MLRKFFKWLNKNEDELEVDFNLPEGETSKFILKVDDIQVGTLYSKKGEWFFEYSEDFKNNKEIYNRIIGFPQLDKKYHSPNLWPFFQVRIPGLKQPAIKEILEKENIDKTNPAALLKRFGYKTITDPYELITV